MKVNYTDMLAEFGIGSAHPGGFSKTKQMMMEIDIQETMTILECGCGTGQTAAYLQQLYDCNVIAVEAHPMMAAKAKQRFAQNQLPIVLLQEKIESMPLGNESVDLAVAESVLSFCQLDQAISEILRVLRQGSLMYANELICTESLRPEEKNQLSSIYGFTSLFTESEWKKTLLGLGFASVVITGQTSASQLQHDDGDKGNDMMPSPSISPTSFATLQSHQQTMNLFGDKIGHALIKATK
ncbi:class I SAM-dependent methyltransferase [Bacillus sp. JCM 19041]|uniref:class I SAM-dependent methyltransferase n=1 Tax=Bacillus sp. JCM 19041 TaxID=1460637 RepID=UPI0006D24C07